MAKAYTPGLTIVEKTIIHKERKLPLKGKVLVKKGQTVKSDDLVAATHLPGNVYMLNIANLLGCNPNEINAYLVKKEGDSLEIDEVIAETPGLFGKWFKTYVKSPLKGTIENISSATGQAVLREPPIPVEVKAYVNGVVEEVIPEEGVVVKTVGTFIQGIFGIGGEVTGLIHMASKTPDDVLEESHINFDMKGKIIVGGSLVTAAALKKAVEVGVAGVVVGGYDANDLKEFLGYDIGVAITGTEKLGITLVVTEGFANIRMADKTFGLLKKVEGKQASINGATQIRAGVIRPEVIVPAKVENIHEEKIDHSTKGMFVGTDVRIIRNPHFGEVVKVSELPEQPVIIPTGAKVRVVKVKTADGEEILLPRANVEIIEE